MDDVGIFRTTIEVQNLAMRGSRRALPETLVDTGSEYTWVPRRVRGTGRHHAPRRSLPRRAEPEDRSRTKGIGAGRAGDHRSGLGLNGPTTFRALAHDAQPHVSARITDQQKAPQVPFNPPPLGTSSPRSAPAASGTRCA